MLGSLGPSCNPSEYAILSNQSGAARFDGFDLSQIDRRSAKASGELRHVEQNAGWWLDRTKLRTRGATDAGLDVADRLLKRPVLLSVVSV